MKDYKFLDVYMNQDKVGTLAILQTKQIAFEYDPNWLISGFSISPFSLPLRKGVFIAEMTPFDGLFGVFSDSLPDGWGRLLVDRMLLKEKINPFELSGLNRLAIVGDMGMGALCYIPSFQLSNATFENDFDRLALQCKKILNTENVTDLDELFRLGGSSGGARPKILTEIDHEPWIIKFPAMNDPIDIGMYEYRYALCARTCGIEITECRLFPSKKGSGYFGTKRFDYFKKDDKWMRRHMISVSALLETTHRIPNLDYHTLMHLTLELTKDFAEVEKLYRLMCFNIFSHNRDDHSKNFSFLYDAENRKWILSPAYDLTYSNSLGGEHATCVNGNGSNPSIEDILSVATKIGIDVHKAKETANEIQQIVQEQLGDILTEFK